MRTKHTPGPWVVQESLTVHFKFDIAKSDFSEFIAATYEGTSEADAQLIAAAPELLEALKEMTALCRLHVLNKDVYKQALKAEAIIQKATGGQS